MNSQDLLPENKLCLQTETLRLVAFSMEPVPTLFSFAKKKKGSHDKSRKIITRGNVFSHNFMGKEEETRGV